MILIMFFQFLPVLHQLLPAARHCHRDSIINLQDAVRKLYRCVVDLKMKAELEDGWGPEVAGWNVGKGHWPRLFLPL